MKHLITVLLLISLQTKGQTIDKIVQNTATAVADARIAELAKSIDSILIIKTTRTGAFVLDTIIIPKNEARIYQLSITGTRGVDMASGVKFLAARNDNGIYSIKRVADDWAYTGITGHVWEVVILNNRLIVRMKSSVAYSIKWEYKRHNL